MLTQVSGKCHGSRSFPVYRSGSIRTKLLHVRLSSVFRKYGPRCLEKLNVREEGRSRAGGVTPTPFPSNMPELRHHATWVPAPRTSYCKCRAACMRTCLSQHVDGCWRVSCAKLGPTPTYHKPGTCRRRLASKATPGTRQKRRKPSMPRVAVC